MENKDKTIRQLKEYNEVFAVLSDEILKAGQIDMQENGASHCKIVVKNDWKSLDMPESHETFIFQRPFTVQQMETLRQGHIPQEMEDKWFWFMEGDTLFAHRSWTGFCIYRIDFKPNHHHVVTVNRDPKQYSCTSIDEDAKQLNNLLNWWSQDTYDAYHAWIDETVNMLKKSGRIPDKLMISGQEVDALFFHAPKEIHGFLSNWYTSPFDLDGIHFSSVEQYIMYRKCMIFGDETSAKAVLATEDPAMQQSIGRNASGYIGSVWAGIRQMVVFRGLMAKFSQNADLKQKLLDTGDAYLVECSGSDKIWACGIRVNDDKRFDAANWTGDNILGFALMEVRDAIKRMKPLYLG